jgi:phenylacetate-coenzyme A ligase PaaK-like adenylate-forming protein
VFRARLAESAGISAVRNFYGMAEQVGSVFVEGEDGLLYPPWFADVVIRDPQTLAPLPPGRTGVVQVVSLLPRSYPGHSLLTEDLGVIEHIDGAAPGRCGKGFRILGRVPKTELRGCSDVAAARLSA